MELNPSNSSNLEQLALKGLIAAGVTCSASYCCCCCYCCCATTAGDEVVGETAGRTMRRDGGNAASGVRATQSSAQIGRA